MGAVLTKNFIKRCFDKGRLGQERAVLASNLLTGGQSFLKRPVFKKRHFGICSKTYF